MNKQANNNGIVDAIAATSIVVNSAPSFFIVGVVTTDIGDYDDFAYSVTLQTDGKILLAGESYYDFALVRYNANGSLDTSFDDDGILKTDFSNSYDYGRSVTLQADGKILVAGESNYQFALARYNANGSLDTSFSDDGKVTTSFGADYYYVSGNAVTVQADGKILVAGTSGNSNSNFTLVRYNANGSLDTSFDSDGIVITSSSAASTGWSPDYGYSVIVQTDGKILVVGTGYNQNNFYQFSLLRYNDDGSLDSSFDSDGIVSTNFASNTSAQAYSSIIQTDGKILVAGTSEGDFALARYNSDGFLDASFDDDGKVTTDLGSFSDVGRSITVQQDGKILVAGYSRNGGQYDFALVRYNSNGSLDTSFDVDGKVTTPISAYDDYGFSVTVQTDGKILVAGSTGDFALVRYNSDGSLDNTFGTAINTLASMAYFYEDNNYPTQLSSGARIVDAQLAAQGHYAGASITLTRHSGANPEDIFSSNGSLYFNGNTAMLDGLNIGTVINNNGMLKITFNSNATQARVNQTLSSLFYSNTSQNPASSVQIDWLFNDGNSGAQGLGGELTTQGTTTVNIIAHNDAPILNTPTAIEYVDTLFDDTFLSATGTLIASDVDSNVLTYGIDNGTDNGDGTVSLIKGYGTLTVNQATGVYSFTPNDLLFDRLNSNKSISFNVWVRDDSFSYNSKTLIVNVTQNGITESIGNDTLVGSTNNDVIHGFSGDDVLFGKEGNDTLIGEIGDDILVGGAGNDVLGGVSGNNTLKGGGGNDKLFIGSGYNQLTGGAGRDIFHFVSTSNSTITDFVPADDTIRLENDFFTVLTVNGQLNAANFVIASAAADSNDYLVYDKATGELLYDADGNGAEAALKIAMLGVNLNLTNADFMVV